MKAQIQWTIICFLHWNYLRHINISALHSTLQYYCSVFGYFAGRRGAVCSLLGAGCNLRGAGHGLRGAGCEMLSLILEFQTCQSGLCFAHVVTIH